jgi:glycosyltransferase involved in cell wall biosynthesis
MLATDVGGLRSQIGDGGLVVPCSVDAVRDGLDRLLTDGAELASYHAALERRPGSSEVWTALADQLVAVLHETVERTRPTGSSRRRPG